MEAPASDGNAEGPPSKVRKLQVFHEPSGGVDSAGELANDEKGPESSPQSVADTPMELEPTADIGKPSNDVGTGTLQEQEDSPQQGSAAIEVVEVEDTQEPTLAESEPTLFFEAPNLETMEARTLINLIRN